MAVPGLSLLSCKTGEPERGLRGAKRVPVLVRQKYEAAQARRVSDQPWLKQTPTQPPLGLQHRIGYCTWMSRDRRVNSSVGGAKKRFCCRRRGLRKRSLPLEPAFTTMTIHFFQTPKVIAFHSPPNVCTHNNKHKQLCRSPVLHFLQ